MSIIVKNTILIGLMDMLCPYPCKGCGKLGEAFCDCCKNDILLGRVNYCPSCQRAVNGGRCKFCQLPPVFMLGWKDTIVGELVQEYKYQSRRALGKVLAEMMEEILPAIDGEVEIVPLPTAQKHIRERGFDHTLNVARKIAKKRGWGVSRLLVRAKDTVQVGASEKLRIRQANEAYEVAGRANSATTYVVFDDVWTTGASIKAATKKLRKAGAHKIIIAVLAVSRARD